MPELPEVESVVQDIVPFVVGKRVKKIEVLSPRIIQTDEKKFLKEIIGSVISHIERRGKYILIYLANKKILVVHLRMTGGLIFTIPEKSSSHSYVRVRFVLDDKSELLYVDSRTLGTMHLIESKEEIQGLHQLGPEPLSEEFSVEYLERLLKRKKGSIKGALLDQRNIAGLGNIYADESLFFAGILPNREPSSLTKKEIGKLYQGIRKVISDALQEGGTTFRDYRNGKGESGQYQERLKVYGRNKKECVKCGAEIQKTRVAGRGTHFCLKCQK